MLTQRQQDILGTLIQEYIALAQPISSQVLEERHDFGVSSATIRNELMALSNKGFLEQPHTSAGRIPTDKGYRFFVDALSQKKSRVKDTRLPEQREDPAAFLYSLARELAQASSAFAAISWQDMFLKEGWEGLFSQPEFEERETFFDFARFLEDFEKNAEQFSFSGTLYVAIGRENRFSKIKDFSIMAADCSFPGIAHARIALLGPTRMAYDKNFSLLHSLIESVHGE